MAPALPPAAFSHSELQLETIRRGRMFGRISRASFPDPLGIGAGTSRFSAVDGSFRVLYLGRTFEVCFVETILRDRGDGRVGSLPVAEGELAARTYARIRVARPLRVVDLRGGKPLIMGVPSDVVRASSHTLARAWAAAFYAHASRPDGIIYPSRLNGDDNLAVFDRGVGRLEVSETFALMEMPALADVLDTYRIAVVTGEGRD